MRRLTFKEKAEMRRFGDRYRAWFKRPNGVPFHKDFRRRDQMEAFILQAQAAGCKYIDFDNTDSGVEA